MKTNDLANYDGKDGKKAYVAYNGKVYDVSKSKLWARGVHMGKHKAGTDLTVELGGAPHGEEVLEKLEVVGEIEKEDFLQIADKKEKLRELYRKFHPHPVLIHNPMGVFLFGALMQALYLLTKDISFERAAFYSFIFATLATYPAVLSGLFSWWINYEATLTKIFKAKLLFSALLCITSTLICILRFLRPEIYFEGGLMTIFYNGLIVFSVASISYVAYNGGKITWPS